MSAQKHLRDMAALYPNFKINPSKLVILEETEKSFRVSIAQAHISFDISKSKAEVVEA